MCGSNLAPVRSFIMAIVRVEADITELPHDLGVSGSCLKCLLQTDLYQDEILATDGGPCPVTSFSRSGILLILEELKGRTHLNLFRMKDETQTPGQAPEVPRVLKNDLGRLPGSATVDQLLLLPQCDSSTSPRECGYSVELSGLWFSTFILHNCLHHANQHCVITMRSCDWSLLNNQF
ncbi:unnamed protein product [Lota lota]